MANTNYSYNSQQVSKALSTLNDVSDALKKNGAKLKSELDTMLSNWDSKYKSDFISSNNMQLSEQIQSLAEAVKAYATAVETLSGQLGKKENEAMKVLKG